jgi:hypothetical protein
LKSEGMLEASLQHSLMEGERNLPPEEELDGILL